MWEIGNILPILMVSSKVTGRAVTFLQRSVVARNIVLLHMEAFQPFQDSASQDHKETDLDTIVGCLPLLPTRIWCNAVYATS